VFCDLTRDDGAAEVFGELSRGALFDRVPAA
jgi:hypothetical protein